MDFDSVQNLYWVKIYENVKLNVKEKKIYYKIFELNYGQDRSSGGNSFWY